MTIDTEQQARTAPVADTADDTADLTARPAVSGADTSNIDKVLAGVHVHEADTDGDIDPDSLEGRLRMELPGHTHYRTGNVVPAPIQALIKGLGGDPNEVVGGPRSIKAVFSEPAGVWLIEVQECHDGDHGYTVSIDGPGIEMTRHPKTVDEVLRIIRFARDTLAIS